MRFLVDAQLPPALARFLTAEGHFSQHVYDLGLSIASDRVIWDFALEHQAAIVTKDQDFFDMVMLAKVAPSVVWVRLGNTRREQLLKQMAEKLPRIVELLEDGDTLVELR